MKLFSGKLKYILASTGLFCMSANSLCAFEQQSSALLGDGYCHRLLRVEPGNLSVTGRAGLLRHGGAVQGEMGSGFYLLTLEIT